MAIVKEISREPLEFKWGNAGGRGKNSQFYRSFTYGGIDYALHDCVCLWPEGASQLYVGKLVKIWETNTLLKKVKVQWFFRPSEISQYLKDEKVGKNEVLFASGKGVGVTNVNPLEAIARKCNVVCISKDIRNPEPSNEDICRADYFFYRYFDVDNYNISDKWGDHAGELEVKSIFNRINDVSNYSGITPHLVDDRGAIGCKVNRNLLTTGLSEDPKSKSPEKASSYDNMVSSSEKAMKRYEGLNNRPAKKMKLEIGDKESKETKLISPKERTNNSSNGDLGPLKETKIISPKEATIASLDALVAKEKKIISPKERTNNSSNGALGPSKETKIISPREAKIASKDALVRRKDHPLDVMLNPLDVVPNRKDDQVFENRKVNLPSKFDNNPKNVAPSKYSINLSPIAIDKSKKIVVTRRPNAEKNTWFKVIPWEDRILTAQEQGTIILLQNLDSEYTSVEVEDIIRHVFQEKCFAKMVQHTALSRPACGEALIILKSKEVVDRVLKQLHDSCLMLPNGRPLVGGPARFPKVFEKQANFIGHLSIEKIKHKMQKDTKEAVSTSHHSQANTIEYEMALEWFLLEARSTKCWKTLYKNHADEMENLKAKVKSK